MNEEDYFYAINSPFSPHLIGTLYKEIELGNWYYSPSKQYRCDVSEETRKSIQELLPYEISCCGFFKNIPGWEYKIHKDILRAAALNMQLCDDNDDFKVYSYSNDQQQKIRVPYTKNKPILINVRNFHNVHNVSPDKTRYILSVGCKTDSYETIRERFKNIN